MNHVVKNDDKEKYVYSGYGKTFDGKGYWSFNDEYARIVIIFVVDNSSSSHTENLKKDFLILGVGDTFGINGSFDTPKKLMLVLVSERQSFVWVCIIMVIIVIYF